MTVEAMPSIVFKVGNGIQVLLKWIDKARQKCESLTKTKGNRIVRKVAKVYRRMMVVQERGGYGTMKRGVWLKRRIEWT
jgi:hypothetical protein